MPQTAASGLDPQTFLRSFHGIRYQVKDVARSLAFYTQQLGFELEHLQLPVFANVSRCFAHLAGEILLLRSRQGFFERLGPDRVVLRRFFAEARQQVFELGEIGPDRVLPVGGAFKVRLIFGFELYGGTTWYYVMLVFAALTLLLCINLLRTRVGRAWRAIHAHETVAEALGINVAAYKLLAFVISSAIAAVAGALFAYYRSFVSVEAFSLFLTIQYVAMVIIGGMGSLLGAILGALFVTVFPYVIERALLALPDAQNYAGQLFAVNYAA